MNISNTLLDQVKKIVQFLQIMLSKYNNNSSTYVWAERLLSSWKQASRHGEPGRWESSKDGLGGGYTGSPGVQTQTGHPRRPDEAVWGELIGSTLLWISYNIRIFYWIYCQKWKMYLCVLQPMHFLIVMKVFFLESLFMKREDK